MAAHEPCQIRKKAALRGVYHVQLVTWLFFFLPFPPISKYEAKDSRMFQMKQLILLFVFIHISFILYASTFPANITSSNIQDDVKTLNSLDISIESVSNQVIQTWVTREQFQVLQQRGFEIVELPNLAKAYAEQLWAETKDTRDPMNAYYSYDEFVAFLQSTATQYSSICQLVTIGTTVQNRPIYMLKISDNVSLEENEPEVKLDAAMHGNEVVGYDLLIRLIQLLTTRYTADTRIANIVNNTELWINPLFNPDGYVLMQRENAHNVDLNRHFPDFVDDPVNTTEGREPEIAAQMNFAAQHTINLALNYHCGNLVMNYPWDKIAELAPDNDLYINISEEYTSHNDPMWNSTDYLHGITNGYAWYQVYGSIIDWIYYYYNCLDITCEVSYDYWPNASTLPTYWMQNQESLLSYIEYAQQGIKGEVTDALFHPLAATLHIEGIDKDISTDSDVGDYHRILLPGTYNITASAPGYVSETINNVVVSANNGTTIDFRLQTIVEADFVGYVKDMNGLAIPGATVELSTTRIPSVQTDTDGYFVFQNLPLGLYTLTVTLNGMTRFNMQYAWNVGNQYPTIIVLQPAIFEEHFENGLSLWQVTGTWGIQETDSNHDLTDSPGENYVDSQEVFAYLIQPISLLNIVNPTISFRVKYDLESSHDYGYFEVSSNGTTWIPLATYDGNHDWMMVSYSLADFIGRHCYLRFRMTTDAAGHIFDGIHIDDIVVNGNQLNLITWGDVDNDGIITKADAQAVLDYSVGLDPLPSIDPRPWTDNRLDRADTNNDGNVLAMDASLILRYLKGDLSQMPVQSGTAITYSDPVISISNSVSQLFLNVLHFEYLFALNATLLPTVMDSNFRLNNSLNFIDLLTSSNIQSNSLMLGYASTQMVQGSVDVFTTTIPLINAQNPFTANLIVNETPRTLVVDSLPVTDPIAVPTVSYLNQNYPNPFNPGTNISFDLSKQGQIKLVIYNIRGEKVRTLVNSKQEAGTYHLTWNGTDDNGSPVASGMYFCRLETEDQHFNRKMLLIK